MKSPIKLDVKSNLLGNFCFISKMLSIQHHIITAERSMHIGTASSTTINGEMDNC